MSEPKKPESWEVVFSLNAKRQKKKLPLSILEQLATLLWDLEHHGPIQPEWSHYGLLKKSPGVPENAYHCHIKSGRPTYVVCWHIENKKIKIIEIFYVGTHEKAPY